MAKILTGIVVSKKTDKTIIVLVETRKTHPIYKKQYTISQRISAHDETNQAKQGDKVTIVETRPISATKRFKLETIIAKAGIAHIDEADVLEVIKPKKEVKETADTKVMSDKEETK